MSLILLCNDFDFVTEQEKTNVKTSNEVFDNIEQNKKCLSFLNDGTALVETEKIVDPDK